MTEQSSVRRIVRASHDSENPYFMMLRATAQNKALSYEARGLIAYLLSKPDDWEVMIEDLCQECGRGRVYRIIKDLLDAKYLERIYHRDDKGKIVYVEYVVHEQPFIENPKVDKPKMGKQKKGNPKVGNRTRHKRDSTHKREKAQKKELPAVPSDAAMAILTAFAEAQSGYLVERETHFVDDAEWLASQFTPQDISMYMAQLRKQDFWAMKVVSLQYVRQHIATEYKPTNGNGNHPATPRISANQQVLIQQMADELNLPYEVVLAERLAEWNK